jgi:hypothetical protein
MFLATPGTKPHLSDTTAERGENTSLIAERFYDRQ